MKLFTKHPHSVGETYFEHMHMAFTFGAKMIGGGLACIVHGLFPFLWETKASDVLLKQAESYIKRMPELDERVNSLEKIILSKKKPVLEKQKEKEFEY